MKAKLLSVGIIFILFTTINFGQLLFEENFDYGSTTGDLTTVSSGKWLKHSGTGNPIQYTTSGLTFDGYPSSTGGAAIIMSGSGSREDIHYNVGTLNSGSIYFSFLINVTSISISDDYYIHFSGTSTNHGAKVFLTKSADPEKIDIGISKISSNGNYGADDSISTNSTILIVAKYTFNDNTVSDDEFSLFIIKGSIPESEPTPDITISNTENDINSLGGIALRQSTPSVSFIIDGIRVSTSWSESALPVELSSFTASTLSNSVKLNWKTQTEIQNYGFDIERAAADKNNWQKIGFVKGSGNTNSPKEYSFTDKNLRDGKYFYRLKQLDTDGKFEFSYQVEAVILKPVQFSLKQNYPNPFNPSTNISYSIPVEGKVKLSVFNLLGQQVAKLVDEYKSAGEYTAVFDAKGLSSGLYFYKLEAGASTIVKKMTLLR